MGRLSKLVKNTEQEAIEKWSTQRRPEGCGARKNSGGGHSQVGLAGEAWRKSSGCGTTEEKGSRRVNRRRTHPYLDHAVTVGIGDVGLQASKQGLIVVFEVKVLQP